MDCAKVSVRLRAPSQSLTYGDFDCEFGFDSHERSCSHAALNLSQVIVVEHNYRLGPLGFLALEELQVRHLASAGTVP